MLLTDFWIVFRTTKKLGNVTFSISGKGVTYTDFFGRTELAWSDVTHVSRKRLGALVYFGTNGRLFLSRRAFRDKEDMDQVLGHPLPTTKQAYSV
jgi:hypothetical protein